MSLLGVLVLFYFILFLFGMFANDVAHTRVGPHRAFRSIPVLELEKKKLHEDFHGAVQVLIIGSPTYHKCLRLSILTTCSRRNSITL